VNKLAPLAVLLVIAIAPAAVAVAQTPATSDKKAVAKKTTRSVSGTVRSAGGDAVVVSGRDKGKDAEWTFAVEATTNVRKGSKSIMAGDLKTGDAVQVRYVERDGRAMAESILVKAPRKETKKAAK